MKNIPEKGFYFDETIIKTTGKKRHTYYYDGRKLTGVTSVLGVIAKDGLIQWSADMAAATALEMDAVAGIRAEYDAIQKIEDWKEKKAAKAELDKKYPMYKEARTAHLKHRDAAADIGTLVHQAIEMYIKSQIFGSEYPMPTLDAQGKKMLSNFIGWSEKHDVKFLESEKKMYSPTHWVAGTCDFVCEIRGKKYVGDLKTSASIFGRTPFYQTAGYRIMLEEMGAGHFHGSVIVNIKKSGKFNEEEDVHWSYDYASDKEAFLACVKLYRLINNY